MHARHPTDPALKLPGLDVAHFPDFSGRVGQAGTGRMVRWACRVHIKTIGKLDHFQGEKNEPGNILT